MFSSFNLCLIFFLVISSNRHCDRKHASMSEYLASRIFENVTALDLIFRPTFCFPAKKYLQSSRTIKTKSATIAFNFFSLPFLLLALPLSPFFFLR